MRQRATMASTYVELRRANIARNQAKLRSLGHAAPAPVVAKRRAAPRKRKWLLAATAVGGDTTTRPRRSSRLDGKAAVDYKEPCLGWGLVAPPPSLVVPANVVGAGTPTKGEYTEPCKYTSSREALESSAVGTEKACEVRRPAALGASAGTRDITLDLSVLDKQVGGAVAGLGRRRLLVRHGAGVLRALRGGGARGQGHEPACARRRAGDHRPR